MVELVLFVVFGAVAVGGGLAVVFARNPVYGAMALMGTMVALAIFYVVQLAHLIAAVQVIVYAGAVMTLFLFVIMLIGVDRAEDLTERLPWQRQAAGVVGLVLVVAAGLLAVRGSFRWIIPGRSGLAANGTPEEVSAVLFEGWVLPFEVTSLLLVIAAVGALALALFRPLRRRVGDRP